MDRYPKESRKTLELCVTVLWFWPPHWLMSDTAWGLEVGWEWEGYVHILEARYFMSWHINDFGSLVLFICQNIHLKICQMDSGLFGNKKSLNLYPDLTVGYILRAFTYLLLRSVFVDLTFFWASTFSYHFLDLVENFDEASKNEESYIESASGEGTTWPSYSQLLFYIMNAFSNSVHGSDKI